MNSNYGKGSSGSLNNFQFDFGIGSTGSKSLNDQKNQNQSSSFLSSYPTTQSKPIWQSNKPSWTHQPAPNQAARPVTMSAPTSMVGDIFGKSWGSSAPSGTASTTGILNKNANLFGDLVSSAIGQGKTNNNVPLKNVAPASESIAPPYSKGNLVDKLRKTGNPVKGGGNWGSSENFGGFSGAYTSGSGNVNPNGKNPNLVGPSLKSTPGAGIGSGVSTNKDPFGSLVDFSSKQSGSLNMSNKSNKANVGNDSFGDFQNASKSSTTTFLSSGFGSGTSFNSNMDDFGIPTKGFASQSQPPAQPSSGDPFSIFFSASSTSAGSATTPSVGAAEQKFSEADDWGLNSDFGGCHDSDGATTELEGLPPPPAGVTASSAKNKGIDSQKQGQYADAIKWLSWSVVLLEKTSNKTETMDVLSCRASCYKEVGEYKKAVADCSKVLEQNDANVSVLVQRALLYESMEKYKLGAEDLKAVLKIDPGNRIARSTVHRLTKMAE